MINNGFMSSLMDFGMRDLGKFRKGREKKGEGREEAGKGRVMFLTCCFLFLLLRLSRMVCLFHWTQQFSRETFGHRSISNAGMFIYIISGILFSYPSSFSPLSISFNRVTPDLYTRSVNGFTALPS